MQQPDLKVAAVIPAETQSMATAHPVLFEGDEGVVQPVGESVWVLVQDAGQSVSLTVTVPMFVHDDGFAQLP